MIIIMSSASFHIMLLFPVGSLFTNCSVYLCNSCKSDVDDSYKVVTVVIFSEH